MLYTTADTTSTYIRDPKGVYGMPELAAGFQPDTTLPAGAINTGLRQGDTELWVVPDDPSVIYLKTHDSIEGWPRGSDPLCA